MISEEVSKQPWGLGIICKYWPVRHPSCEEDNKTVECSKLWARDDYICIISSQLLIWTESQCQKLTDIRITQQFLKFRINVTEERDKKREKETYPNPHSSLPGETDVLVGVPVFVPHHWRLSLSASSGATTPADFHCELGWKYCCSEVVKLSSPELSTR